MYYAGKRRQDALERERAAQVPPQRTEAPAATAGPSEDAIEKLERLGRLHEQGVLTDEEFARQKASVLG